MSPRNRALLQIHVAALFFGLAGLFGKLISLPSPLIALGRVFFASISLGLLLLALKQSPRLDRGRDYLVMGVLGLILAVHWVAFFQAIQVSTVAIGLVTYSTFPVFVTLLEPLFFKNRLRPVDLILATITFLGVALVIPTWNLGSHATQGALWGTFSGLTFALLSILNRVFAGRYPSAIVALYQDGVATILLLPFLLTTSAPVRPRDLGLLVLLGVVFTAGSHTLFIRGLVHVRAQTASIIASLEPVYGIAAAALLFGEIPTLRTVLGGLIVLGAAFYTTIMDTRTVESRKGEVT